jgi:hypothetical protein
VVVIIASTTSPTSGAEAHAQERAVLHAKLQYVEAERDLYRQRPRAKRPRLVARQAGI